MQRSDQQEKAVKGEQGDLQAVEDGLIEGCSREVRRNRHEGGAQERRSQRAGDQDSDGIARKSPRHTQAKSGRSLSLPLQVLRLLEFAALSPGVENGFVEAGDRRFGGVAEFFEAEEFLDGGQEGEVVEVGLAGGA